MSFHAQRFNRSASRYESGAEIQTRMADRLLDLWNSPAPANILELGCGTGILTRRLRKRFPAASILATDAAPAMLEQARIHCGKDPLLEFTEQNAEGLVSISEVIAAQIPFDIVASNALVQWFPDLDRHLKFVQNILKPDGFYLISGFARSNFPELNGLLSEPPFSYQNFPGHDLKSVETNAHPSGWKVMAIQGWEEKEILSSALDVLHRLQVLGSTRDPREGGRLNRKNLDHLIAEYTRRFSEPSGVRLTWKPWVALLRRQ